MRSTTALWFDIEATFSELHELCIEARAAELAMQKRDEEKRLFQGGRSSTPPRAEGAGLEAASSKGSDARDVRDARHARDARARELSRDLAFAEAHPQGADLVELRSRLRKRLSWLKSRLAEALSEHDVYYTLFPVVVYTDELVNAIAPTAVARWEPLQSELYDLSNGGEVFYSVLEERLRQEETHPIVFEVFYFCLSDGFTGAYLADPRKIDEMKARLSERIRPKPIDADSDARKEAPPVTLVRFPWQLHAAGGALVLAAYLLYTWLGWTAS
jgi:type IV/VI secretion system ImpK/VasF family protein